MMLGSPFPLAGNRRLGISPPSGRGDQRHDNPFESSSNQVDAGTEEGGAGAAVAEDEVARMALRCLLKEWDAQVSEIVESRTCACENDSAFTRVMQTINRMVV